MVISTENGSVKLIYNGNPVDGKCPDSGDVYVKSNHIGFTKFNEFYTPDAAIYMFDNFDRRFINRKYVDDGYIDFYDDISYNSATKKYTLSNKSRYDFNSYTCFNKESSCTEVAYF